MIAGEALSQFNAGVKSSLVKKGHVMSKYKEKNVATEPSSMFTNATMSLEGEILTVVDAAIADPEQRRALKSVFSRTLWRWSNSWDRNFKFDPKEVTTLE